MDNDSSKPLGIVTETSNDGHGIPYTSQPSLHFLHLNSPKLLGRTLRGASRHSSRLRAKYLSRLEHSAPHPTTHATHGAHGRVLLLLRDFCDHDFCRC